MNLRKRDKIALKLIEYFRGKYDITLGDDNKHIQRRGAFKRMKDLMRKHHLVFPAPLDHNPEFLDMAHAIGIPADQLKVFRWEIKGLTQSPVSLD